MAITLTHYDRKDLKLHYPNLNCSIKRRIVWGTLDIACSFDQNTNELIWDDDVNTYIRDSYEVRLDFNQFDSFGFPKVYEDSAKIQRFSQEYKVKLESLHINEGDDNSCCLGIFPEYDWHGVLAYIEEKVVPFFYWQSYRRLFDEEPWNGCSHGIKGIEEAVSTSLQTLHKGNLRNNQCFCGSGKKYKKCCMRRDVILTRELKKLNNQKNVV